MLIIFRKSPFLLGIIALLLCATSCFAKSKKEKDYTFMQRGEIELRKAVGDSVSKIILRAHRIEIFTDSCSARRLDRDGRTIVKYLIADSCNLSSDMKVYGEFVPYLTVKFKRFKKVVVALYDFRLHKWMLKDADGKLLCRYDLKSAEILRFAFLTLPQDKYLNELIKEQTK